MIKIGIDADGMAGLDSLWQRKVDAGFGEALAWLQRSASQSAPRRTGRLAASASVTRTGSLSGTLLYGAPYASYLYEGTGLYGPARRLIVIVPRHKRALWWKGAAHPVARVVQKGIRPRDFVSNAAADIAAAFLRGFQSRA